MPTLHIIFGAHYNQSSCENRQEEVTGMARKRNTGRRCLFESLESRQMMAGDVTAQIANGNLTIKGDASNNNIAVAIAAGTVTITSADTMVNGASATGGVALAGTLTGNVKVNLKGGTDTLTLTGPLTVP